MTNEVVCPSPLRLVAGLGGAAVSAVAAAGLMVGALLSTADTWTRASSAEQALGGMLALAAAGAMVAAAACGAWSTPEGRPGRTAARAAAISVPLALLLWLAALLG